MKEKRREVEGRIFSHENGLGTVTRSMIEERAREIALIDGRSRATREDLLRARQELLRMRGIRDEIEDIDEDYESLDPSETPAAHGHHAPNFEPEDEEQVQFELVEQGVEEADHEQMLEGHYAQEEEEEAEGQEERKTRNRPEKGKRRPKGSEEEEEGREAS